MKFKQHLGLLALATSAWFVFWLLGLPAYYQQYSSEALGAASVLLSVLISLVALFILARTRPEVRMSRAFWLSFYYTVPFAILDSWYCGVHLGHGATYLLQYWYLTIFYISPWLTFIPTVWLLRTANPPSQ